MSQDEKKPDQKQKPDNGIHFDEHPIKHEPLALQPESALNVANGISVFSDRESVFLFLIVILVVALAGIALIYAAKS